jgi:hypothetical protein
MPTPGDNGAFDRFIRHPYLPWVATAVASQAILVGVMLLLAQLN